MAGKKLLSFFVLLSVFISENVAAQYTLVKPNGYLELSGYVVGFYNQRFYTAADKSHAKNRFAMDYVVIRLDGNVNRRWNYQLQLNNAALFDPSTSDGFLMDAYVAYNSLVDNLEIKAGYTKIPFCRSSLVSNTESPFIQRPEVTRGAFTRRDVGTTLRYSLLNKKINLYAGAYTGMGSQSLLGDNDAGGHLEYAGRIETSFPTRYRKTEIDLIHSALPVVALAADVRYANKNTDYGPNYPYEVLNGKKLSYSADADFCFQGFSFHGEWLAFRMTPVNKSYLYGKATDHFFAKGVIAAANYYVKKYKTVMALRYDGFNTNDLISGDNANTISYGLNYLFDGLRSCMKLQFCQRLKDPAAAKVWSRDQVRIAYQLQF